MAPAGSLDKRALLRRVSIFSGLEDEDLDSLLRITATKRLAAREVLCRKGDRGSQTYAIMSGRLKATAAGEDGREVVLRIMDPGEVIGEVTLLDGGPRSLTVTAIEPAELLVIQRRDLLPFLERRPRIAIGLLQVLGSRLRTISAELEDTLFLNLPPRLAKKLLSLAENYGRSTAAGVRIDLRLSQHELGEMIGTSRESVNKQLRIWTREGVLTTERGFITLRDPGKLEELAGLSLE